MGLPFASLASFRRAAASFDAISGGSFSRLLMTATQAELSDRFVAPSAVALFDMACCEVARDMFGMPAALSGYSLGFYAAAAFAGVFRPEVATEWIERVNRSMASRFPRGMLAMAVAVGMKEADLKGAFRSAGLSGLRISGINNLTQCVFVGPSSEVAQAAERVGPALLSCKLLPLDTPLHTDYMRPVAEEIAGWWRTVPLKDPEMELISPVDGGRITSDSQIRETMLESLVRPTDWLSVVRAVSSSGVTWALDTSGDGSLGRMTKWADRLLDVVHYTSAFGLPEPQRPAGSRGLRR